MVKTRQMVVHMPGEHNSFLRKLCMANGSIGSRGLPSCASINESPRSGCEMQRGRMRRSRSSKTRGQLTCPVTLSRTRSRPFETYRFPIGSLFMLRNSRSCIICFMSSTKCSSTAPGSDMGWMGRDGSSRATSHIVHGSHVHDSFGGPKLHLVLLRLFIVLAFAGTHCVICKEWMIGVSVGDSVGTANVSVLMTAAGRSYLLASVRSASSPPVHGYVHLPHAPRASQGPRQ